MGGLLPGLVSAFCAGGPKQCGTTTLSGVITTHIFLIFILTINILMRKDVNNCKSMSEGIYIIRLNTSALSSVIQVNIFIGSLGVQRGCMGGTYKDGRGGM